MPAQTISYNYLTIICIRMIGGKKTIILDFLRVCQMLFCEKLPEFVE